MIMNSVNKDEMKRIHDDSFILPNIDNKQYILKQTSIQNGKIAAIGIVKLTAEGILLTDKDLPLVTRAKASKEVIESLRHNLKLIGLDDCYIFCKCPKVQRFMEHMGFNKSQGGTPMIIYL
jgi:hypothetical protein